MNNRTIIPLIAIAGLAAWFLTKKHPVDAALTETERLADEELQAAYAGAYGQEYTNLVMSIIASTRSEIERIESQSPITTQAEIESGIMTAQVNTSRVIADYPIGYGPNDIRPEHAAAGAQAYLTPSGEVVIAYPLVGEEIIPKTVYGTPVTTQAQALESAQRQLEIALTNPNSPNMMKAAEAYFEYAEKLENAITVSQPGTTGYYEAKAAVEAGETVVYLGKLIGTYDSETGETWTVTGWR